MEKYLALDLKLARVASGLSGKDLAHLLGCTKERISRLENANARIAGHEIAQMFVIYGSNPTELFNHLSKAVVEPLLDRLRNMPEPSPAWALHATARTQTLDGLKQRLASLKDYEKA